MANAIIALGGTGQTVLDLLLQFDLLRIGPAQDKGLDDKLSVVFIDQESPQKTAPPPWMLLRGFLAKTSASERVSFHDLSLPRNPKRIKEMINSADRDGYPRPEQAYATDDVLDSTTDAGVFAKPATLAFAWQYLAGEEFANQFDAALADVRGAVVVTSTFGGTGPGATPRILSHLARLGISKVSLVALNEYISHAKARQDARLRTQYRQNSDAFLKQINSLKDGGMAFFQTVFLDCVANGIWDRDSDQMIPPDGNSVWAAAWWTSRFIAEYQQPRVDSTAAGAGRGIAGDEQAVINTRKRYFERSKKAKDGVRFLVEDDFLTAITRDPFMRPYLGRFCGDFFEAFWNKWLDVVSNEKVKGFVTEFADCLGTAYDEVNKAIPTKEKPERDFPALREAFQRADISKRGTDTYHPILAKTAPLAKDVVEAGANELLYRLMRTGGR